MGRAVEPVSLIHEDGPAAFAFLVHCWGFPPPERTDAGLRFTRRDVTIEITHWSRHHEAGFTTTLTSAGDQDGRSAKATLGCLMAAASLGSPQDAPEHSGSAHTIRKRIDQHSIALQRLIPYLNGAAGQELIHRCRNRREFPTEITGIG